MMTVLKFIFQLKKKKNYLSYAIMSRVSVCHNLYVDTRKRKKEIVKLIKSLHSNITYVRK